MAKDLTPRSTGVRRREGADTVGGAWRVGKGRPPEHSQYKKGVSGNTKGRPKGSKNLSTILMDAANAPVTAEIDGRPRRLTKITATAMHLATQAAGGDPRAIARFLEWIDEIEARSAGTKPAPYPFTSADLDVLRLVYERMKLCAAEKARDED